ncbi:MAG: DUF3556 domain-containing protein [Deltaproteobacteria bacterium]|nr:DUF3556 domain-containing protein [Deltaproteobacteria bacterium]
MELELYRPAGRGRLGGQRPTDRHVVRGPALQPGLSLLSGPLGGLGRRLAPAPGLRPYCSGLGLLNPIPPPYDALEWREKPFAEKVRMVCESWALQGYGTPLPVFVVYLLKIAGYVAMWSVFVSFTPGLGGLSRFGEWWAADIAYQKFILWSMLFEVLGLGCGSGPLTGRYMPPVGGALYFLRPGTTKLPLFPGLPIIGRPRRGPVEVLLYAALIVTLVRALIAPVLTFELLLPAAVLVPVLGLVDKTIFLAARGEHYWVVTVVLAVAAFTGASWIPGAKAVHAALWFWAGVSKLNHHFPAVVCVMTSNSPVARFAWLRRLMYRRFPDDLSPSRLAELAAHFGTALELSIPVVLLLGDGGPLTVVGLVMMVALHTFITSNVPMGVPLEWNVIVVYSAFVLFGHHADVSVLSMAPTALVPFVLLFTVVLPLLGNLKPAWISFLVSMRYYAGNWACSVWLFEGESYRKLDRLTKAAPWLLDQLDRFYDRRTSTGLVGKVIAFRLMHLHGRIFGPLVDKAVDDLTRYEWVDGELVAGLALGWNFGDAHLHDEQLLASLQAQCGFAPGELRCIFVESQALFGRTLEYRIRDAATGLIEAGEVPVSALRDRQPWDERPVQASTAA